MPYEQSGTEAEVAANVANIATPATATAPDVANKVNELLTALRNANLIG